MSTVNTARRRLALVGVKNFSGTRRHFREEVQRVYKTAEFSSVQRSQCIAKNNKGKIVGHWESNKRAWYI